MGLHILSRNADLVGKQDHYDPLCPVFPPAALTLSVRTVERHLSNAYLKLGVSGRAGRAAAVADLVRRGLA